MKTLLLRLILRFFWLFPIDAKKVIITSYNGRRFSCNPKYIALYLLNTNAKVYYALINDGEHALPNEIKVIKYRSFKYFFHAMTSKYIIVNSTGIGELLPFRSQQILINTWHGGGYFKTIGNDHFVTPNKLRDRSIAGRNTKYFFASCEKFADQLTRSMRISPESIYRTGLPRNDGMFSLNPQIKTKVHNFFGIDSNLKIVLYAPTYRDGELNSINSSGITPIDVKLVISSLKMKFNNNYILLFKAHHNMLPENVSVQCINASDYEDIQELMIAADVFISDYSSCMWDFCLTKRPGFLYAPDIDEYEKTHSFGTRPEMWPYVICKSNEELEESILSFDPIKNEAKIDRYLNYMGSYEDGHSTQHIFSDIFTDLHIVR